tara:strand:- start:543 stop:719 length:177 start_codon:yes stop_codon:yes gene_type:complete
MLRKDYLGSFVVCLILFSLIGIGVNKVSHLDLTLYFKIIGSFISVGILVGFLTYLTSK